MKKYLTILILLIIYSLQVNGQKSKDALYLKNGSIIYGKLIDITDNQYRMQTSDGSLLAFSSGEVDKFEKVSPSYDGRRAEGLGGSIEAGILMGAQNTEYLAPFSFNITANYTFKRLNSLGAGSGVEFLGVPFSPFFLEYRRLLNERKASPFIYGRIGKLFHVGSEADPDNYLYDKRDFKGGFSATIGTGISWSREDLETFLSFAYRYATTSYKRLDYQQNDATYNNSYNRLEIKFGFRF